jgi:uncharacterized membrane protein YoaK (UPF0700 family)
MLITVGSERSTSSDRRLACTLAAIAGGVNTVAFHAVGFFSANMTGNISAVSDQLASGEWLVGGFYLTIVGCFVAGAIVSAIIINSGKRRGIRGVYAWSILVEAFLMSGLALCEMFLAAKQAGPVLVLGLSFLMGLQNAVVTRISDARVRTTHVSGMATDIGIELAMLIDIARGREPVTEAPPNQSKLQLHLQTILSFLAGGALGVLLFGIAPGGLLFTASAVLIIVGFDGLRRSMKMPAS